MEYGWQIEEEGPIFIAVFLLVFGILHVMSDVNLGPKFGAAFLAAAVTTALLVLIHSSKRGKAGSAH